MDKLVLESGHPEASVQKKLIFCSFFSVFLGGLITTVKVQYPKMVVTSRFLAIVLVFLGYVFFSWSAPLGVRRFFIGTETWGGPVHLEHFIRYFCLLCLPMHCLFAGLSMPLQSKRRFSNWMWCAGSLLLSIGVWYWVCIMKASTVLLLDLLVEDNRLLFISIFFTELMLLGYAVGCIHSELGFEFYSRRFWILLYPIGVFCLFSAISATVCYGLSQTLPFEWDLAWLNGLFPSLRFSVGVLSNAIVYLFLNCFFVFLALYAMSGVVILSMRFFEMAFKGGVSGIVSSGND
ncbi:MAG: hypothetical protein ACKOAU_19450 [Pirellula sp.]